MPVSMNMSLTKPLMLTAALLVTASSAWAQSPLEPHIAETRVICETGPSSTCSRAIHRILDQDRNGNVSFLEMERVRSQAAELVRDRKNTLTPDERAIFGLTLFGLLSAGPSQVFANFDTDGSGALDHDEMFADMRLDARTFAVVASDPDAVDWPSLAARFGKIGQSLIGILPANASR